MPKEFHCIEKHRSTKNIDCRKCSFGNRFRIQNFNELGVVIEKILSELSRKIERGFHLVEPTVRLILDEGAMNSIEHGAAGLDTKQKEAFLVGGADKYHEHVEEKWNGNSVYITYCINQERLLLGFHDQGDGFVPALPIQKPFADLLDKPSGRGISMLCLYADLYWNEKGNTLLCSFDYPKYINEAN